MTISKPVLQFVHVVARARYRLALATLVSALLLSRVALAQQSTPDVHDMTWNRLDEWAGYALNQHEIKALYISDSSPRSSGYEEILEADIVGPTKAWAVRCTFTYGASFGFGIVCDLLPNDGSKASVLVLSRAKSGVDVAGYVLGPAPLRVSGEFFNEALELFFANGDGTRVAGWEYAFGHLYPLRLTLSSQRAEEREIATLASLVAMVVDDSMRSPIMIARLDSYPLIAGEPREDRGQRAAVLELEQRGAAEAAALLKRHLENSRRIDRNDGGAYVLRHRWTPRIYLGLQSGLAYLPTPKGSLGELGGGNLEVVAGLRTNYLSFGLAFGLRLGEVDSSSYAELVEQRSVSSAGFSVGLQARAAYPLVGDLEGAVGLLLRARLRFVDVAGWGEISGATQFGGSLAPTVALQYPIWKMNRFGSRLLLSMEASPEWRFWGQPSVSAPDDQGAAAERLRDGLAGSDWATHVNLGLRFEL